MMGGTLYHVKLEDFGTRLNVKNTLRVRYEIMELEL